MTKAPLKKTQIKTALSKPKISNPLQDCTFGCTEEGVVKCEPVRNGCSHNCGYCYADGWTHRQINPKSLVVYPNLGKAIALQLSRRRSTSKKIKEVHFSVGTDPFQNLPGLLDEVYDAFKVYFF